MQEPQSQNQRLLVSVIVPCYNEERTISLLLDALEKQEYPQAEIEIIIADGMSTDKTREVIRNYANEHPNMQIRVLDNPRKSIPAGVNTAIRSASGKYIIRLDAHSMPDPDYIANCVQALEDSKGDNVGGVWKIKPGGRSIWAESIAVAASHPLAVGDAYYRFSNQSGYVDTVPFGAFKSSLINKIGYFDEDLLSNEDYEFNTRIRDQGGRIWLDPKIRSVYFARPDLPALARQYWRYGYWKARMLRRYPQSLKLRQALPPLFVLAIIALTILSLFFPFAFFLLGLISSIYLVVLVLIGLHLTLKNKKIGLLLGVPVAIATMHLTWGSSFLYSFAYSLISGLSHE